MFAVKDEQLRHLYHSYAMWSLILLVAFVFLHRLFLYEVHCLEPVFPRSYPFCSRDF